MTGCVEDKKKIWRCGVLTAGELDGIGTQMETSPRKGLCYLAVQSWDFVCSAHKVKFFKSCPDFLIQNLYFLRYMCQIIRCGHSARPFYVLKFRVWQTAVHAKS
jgi:hypothetical protein